MRPYILSEVNYAYIKANPYQVAVLPLGATEPHNLHLPYGTDMYEGTAVGERICGEAHRRGAKVVLLPAIPYGTETNMREFPLAMNVNPSTLYRVVTDLIASCVQSGVKKIVLLNSHGGNEMKPLLRELYGTTPAHIFLCSWYNCLSDCFGEIFEHPEDHGGEMETSFLLSTHPHLVARNPDNTLAADAGAVAKTRFEAINRGWVSITRPWHLLTTNSGSGYPHAASPEKAEQMLAKITDRLATFLVELSAATTDEKFPF